MQTSQAWKILYFARVADDRRYASTGGKSGHRRAGCWITSRRSNTTEESAAENIPPWAIRVRVKWRGKSSPHFWWQEWQGKPHPVQDQAGLRPFEGLMRLASAGFRVGCSRLSAMAALDRWSSLEFIPVQNPAYSYPNMKAFRKGGLLLLNRYEISLRLKRQSARWFRQTSVQRKGKKQSSPISNTSLFSQRLNSDQSPFAEIGSTVPQASVQNHRANPSQEPCLDKNPQGKFHKVWQWSKKQMQNISSMEK